MFEEHGEYVISIVDKILFIDAYGPWNLEATLNFDFMIRKAVLDSSLLGSEWAMVANLFGESVYTPESLPILNKHHLWRVQNGLRYIAIVNNKSQNPYADITKTQFDNIYNTVESGLCEEQYFENLNDAMNWLLEKGF